MWTSFIYSFDDFKYNVIFVDHCTKYIWFYLSTQISFFNDLELTTPTQALEDPIWRRAMSNEYDALVQNSTWELVPLEPKHNLVRCNWIFHIKCLSDGSVDRCEALLVAKGFQQQPGIDYHDTLVLLSNPPLYILFSVLWSIVVDLSINWMLTMLFFKATCLKMFS